MASPAPPQPPARLVKLNVGGVLFTTTAATLTERVRGRRAGAGAWGRLRATAASRERGAVRAVLDAFARDVPRAWRRRWHCRAGWRAPGSHPTPRRATPPPLFQAPASMLARLVAGDLPSTTDEGGALFIDRDPTHFRRVLNWLRDGDAAPLPAEAGALREVLVEAEFYAVGGGERGGVKGCSRG